MNLARLKRGELKVESQLSKGSHFFCDAHLPKAQPCLDSVSVAKTGTMSAIDSSLSPQACLGFGNKSEALRVLVAKTTK